MSRWLVVCAFATASLSCGGAAPAAREPDPSPPATTRPTSTVASPDAAPRSGRPYAPSAITPLAEELTDLALAAVAGAPVAPPPLPLAGPLASPAPVEWRDAPPSGPLTVLGIAFEVELVMKRGEPTQDAEGPAQYGAIRLTLALSQGGLRVVGLRPRVLSRRDLGGRLPAGLEPLRAVSRDLLAAIRAEDIGAYQLTDDDRALLDNETVWAQMEEDRVPGARVRELAAMLQSMPEEPIAYALDDVAVLARDPSANLYSLAFDLDPDGGSFALETAPLLAVRRLWPLSDRRSGR